MRDVPPCNPHKEEDEGYLAAKDGRPLATNPYPRGTIRYEQWRLGWQCRTDAALRMKDEGYLAAETGKSLTENPHPRGTIRYSDWRSSWQIRQAEMQRANRLGETA